MKQVIAVLACALLCPLVTYGAQAGGGQNEPNHKASQQQTSQNDSAGGFASPGEKRSYALGMDIGNSLKSMPMDVDLDQLTQGIRDVVEKRKTKLDQKQLQTVMQGIASDMEAAQKHEQKQRAAENLKKGRKFLAENKQKDGVKMLDDGLQYKVIKKGDGPRPRANDSVTVHYTGKLIDGTVFDSSEKRGKPVTFPVDAVIPGWTEALQMMHVGGEYKLFIPPDLAYGKRGAGAQIGPNETLIFDVKLLSIDRNQGADK